MNIYETAARLVKVTRVSHEGKGLEDRLGRRGGPCDTKPGANESGRADTYARSLIGPERRRSPVLTASQASEQRPGASKAISLNQRHRDFDRRSDVFGSA